MPTHFLLRGRKAALPCASGRGFSDASSHLICRPRGGACRVGGVVGRAHQKGVDFRIHHAFSFALLTVVEEVQAMRVAA